MVNIHARALVLGLARSLFFFAYSACLYYGGTLVRNEGLDYAVVFKCVFLNTSETIIITEMYQYYF